MSWIPGLGRFLEGRHGNPLQNSCLENPMDRGTRWATVHGVTKSQTQLKCMHVLSHRLLHPWKVKMTFQQNSTRRLLHVRCGLCLQEAPIRVRRQVCGGQQLEDDVTTVIWRWKWAGALGKEARVVVAWCMVVVAWCVVMVAWCMVMAGWCVVMVGWCMVVGLVEGHKDEGY